MCSSTCKDVCAMPLHVDGLEDAWGCFYQKCVWTSDKTCEDAQALLCLSPDSVLLTALVFFSNGGVAVRDLGAGADQLEDLADPGPSCWASTCSSWCWGSGCHSSCWLLCASSGTHCCWEVVGWGGKSCLSRAGTVRWSSDVPVVVALVVALSSQGRTFALSPSHCQL